MIIKLFTHVHFKLVENHRHFFHIFNFSADVYNIFHTGLSQQHYPEDITHDDDQLSTKPIRQKQLEIMKMMASQDITHDDDQLSTETTRDREDDGIKETEEDFEEEESLFEDIVCYIFHLIVGVL